MFWRPYLLVVICTTRQLLFSFCFVYTCGLVSGYKKQINDFAMDTLVAIFYRTSLQYLCYLQNNAGNLPDQSNSIFTGEFHLYQRKYRPTLNTRNVALMNKHGQFKSSDFQHAISCSNSVNSHDRKFICLFVTEVSDLISLNYRSCISR